MIDKMSRNGVSGDYLHVINECPLIKFVFTTQIKGVIWVEFK